MGGFVVVAGVFLCVCGGGGGGGGGSKGEGRGLYASVLPTEYSSDKTSQPQFCLFSVSLSKSVLVSESCLKICPGLRVLFQDLS